jgi:hypothetical protein
VRRPRRPRRLTRPVAVLAAALIGLGVLGGAAGATLGALGQAVSSHDHEGWHGHGPRDADDWPAGPVGPGPRSGR